MTHLSATAATLVLVFPLADADGAGGSPQGRPEDEELFMSSGGRVTVDVNLAAFKVSPRNIQVHAPDHARLVGSLFPTL